MLTARTLGEIAKVLNRPVVVISGLQQRFELPAFEGQGYADSYLAFLRTVVFLRTMGISEERLIRLWNFEKKLLQLIHADSTGSPTWFLDSCGAFTRRDHRLLLTNYDIGVPIPTMQVQLGLNFAEKMPELFAGAEMGEDTLRVLNEYIPLYAGVLADVAAELPHLRETVKWAARLT